MNRREFFGMASVGAVAISLIGHRALMRPAAEVQDANSRVFHTETEWRARLSPASYRVLRKGDTEMPGSSSLLKEHRVGAFACAGCDQLLFESRTKYDSHTGWPSFWDTVPNAVTRHPDFTIARLRTEIRCSACGGHLGHVFDDGPQPTGLRYCMNGVALTFKPANA